MSFVANNCYQTHNNHIKNNTKTQQKLKNDAKYTGA